jgi:glycosyltransferase involved in cell wall biosynthesis
VSARVLVVVPARNEEERVGNVVRGASPLVERVVVIDDASEDRTAEVAREAGAVVLSRTARGGVGAAISDGYRYALENRFDVAVVMAGDGQMDPADLTRVTAPILEGRADYVKGNRFAHPDVLRSMPLARFVVGRGLSALTRLATGARVHDTQCGYTAISRAALSALEGTPMWTGYGYPNDLIGILTRHHQRIEEVVVRPVYRGEKSGLRPWHVLVILGIIGKSALARRQ